MAVRAVYIPPFAKDAKDGAPGCFATEEGLALVTTEGDEVKLFGLLEAFQARWHGGTSSLHPTLRKGREGWGTRLLRKVGACNN